MIGNLLSIGRSALLSAQAWVSVTGDNIANADTEGYSRRYVVQKEAPAINTAAGELGLGSNAEQVMRYFDKFLEDNYLNESTISSRWTEYDNIMETVESFFNESNSIGLSQTMDNFFNAWQKLALNPDDPSMRMSVLNYGQTLDDIFSSMTSAVKSVQDEMNISISNTVTRVNEISDSIAKLNFQIGASINSESASPNSLYDQRDLLVEELATLVDIKTIDNGAGHFRVQLATGQPLVDDLTPYSLDFQAAQAENRLTPQSEYTGNVLFEGSDDFEYTIEIVSQGEDGKARPAQDDKTQKLENPYFRVSLDGGRTWLQQEQNGVRQDLLFEITALDESAWETDDEGNLIDPGVNPVRVKDLEISFDVSEGFSVGDRFDIVPKTGVYWIEPTRGAENITPMIDGSRADDPTRLTGGKLTAYFGIRDDVCGRYMDELDALAKSLIWEVNRLHSQGAGLDKLTTVTGQVSIAHENQPLGTAQSSSVWYDNLEKGNVNFYFYDTKTDSFFGTSKLDFSSLGSDTENFDPDINTLEDVRDAINNIRISQTTEEGTTDPLSNLQLLKADIQNGKLLITVNTDYHITKNSTDGSMSVESVDATHPANISFAFGEDTTGLLAALGINSFFSGDSSVSLALSTDIARDYTKVNAGRVNGEYEVNTGDNTIATAIGTLAEKSVTVNTFWKTVKQTLPEYYAGLVSQVGSDKLHSETNETYHKTLTDALYERKQSLSGVNLDEEMTNLVKYQSAYKAAAKLITTADEMLGVLLGLKQ